MPRDVEVLPGETRMGRSAYRQALISEMADYMRNMAEGEAVTHEDLMGLLSNQNKAYARGIFNDAAELLKIEGVMFGSIRGVGYRRLPPVESLTKCKRKMVNGINAVRKGFADFVQVPLDRLTETERCKAIEFRQRATNLSSMYQLEM